MLKTLAQLFDATQYETVDIREGFSLNEKSHFRDFRLSCSR